MSGQFHCADWSRAGEGPDWSVLFSEPFPAFLLVIHGHSFLWSKNPLPSPPLPGLQLYC